MRALVRSAASALLLAAAGLCLAAEPAPAVLPQAQVDATLPETTGATHTVRAGGDFQEALDRAAPGDVIELEAGAEYTGPFTLPAKSGEGWIVIRSSAMDALPAEGTRVDPAHAPSMPALVAGEGSVVKSAPGAHHYRFIGVELRPTAGTFLYNLVELGDGTEQQDALAHHIVFDRSYLHGDPRVGARRGIALNSAHTAIVDSWFADFKEQGADSQAIAGWNGPGPFLIRNNHLEAAGENIMFGGATPGIEGMVPGDITISANRLTKKLAWKAGEDAFEGTEWTVKNLLELKNARRVLIDGNVLEHNWPQGQNGIAVLMTVRNEGGAAPWAVVEDVTFSNNLLKGIAGGFNLLGRDDNGMPSGQTSRIDIHNNVLLQMGGDWGTGPLLQVLEGVADLNVERNTAMNPASIIVSEGAPHTNMNFSRNIVKHNEYGIVGSGTGPGMQTLERYFPGATVEENLIVGGEMRSYPEGNVFPMSETDVGFIDRDAGDLRVDPARQLRRGEYPDAGADFTTLCAALAAPERSRHCNFGDTALN